MATSTRDGLCRVGAAVVVSGHPLRVVLDSLLVCIRHRRMSGLPVAAHTALAAELHAALTDNGHADVRESETVHDEPMPTMPIDDAAAELGLSPRQTRRIAARLGGRKVAGRWLLDPQAVAEHVEGQQN